jgi:hypothetical protein
VLECSVGAVAAIDVVQFFAIVALAEREQGDLAFATDNGGANPAIQHPPQTRE